MSVRLFHRGARLVIKVSTAEATHLWIALHRRPVAWPVIFSGAVSLLGYAPAAEPEGVRFRDGSVRWTPGPMWTTVRLRLPSGSPKKQALVAAGLLRAARYAQTGEGTCQA